MKRRKIFKGKWVQQIVLFWLSEAFNFQHPTLCFEAEASGLSFISVHLSSLSDSLSVRCAKTQSQTIRAENSCTVEKSILKLENFNNAYNVMSVIKRYNPSDKIQFFFINKTT